MAPSDDDDVPMAPISPAAYGDEVEPLSDGDYILAQDDPRDAELWDSVDDVI